jgi:Rad3-related DNA helicase
MSGSIANAPMWARWMGLDPATTAFVDVESIFDPKMSPIQLWRGGPQMTGNGYQDSAKVESIVAAINAYRSGRTLVHVYSAQQARILKKHIPDAITYGTDDRRGRAEALKMYLARPDSLLIAQSMRRGVDLHDDKCRTNIIAKVPWSVPVRKVKARKALDSGYYVRETVQEVIQALGRGTRGPEDWCRNYIIDGSFTGLERNFPKYLRDAVIIT